MRARPRRKETSRERCSRPPTRAGSRPSRSPRLPATEAGPPARGRGCRRRGAQALAPIPRSRSQAGQRIARSPDGRGEGHRRPAQARQRAGVPEGRRRQVGRPDRRRQGPAGLSPGREGDPRPGQAEAKATAQKDLQTMHGGRAQALEKVAGHQTETKTQDEQARRQVASGDPGSLRRPPRTRPRSPAQTNSTPTSTPPSKKGRRRPRRPSTMKSTTRCPATSTTLRRPGRTAAPGSRTCSCGLPDEVNVFYERGPRELHRSA